MMPELVRIGGLTLYTYGFMWVVGIWLAVWWGLRRAPRYGVSPDDALDVAFWSILTGIVGGRLAFVLTNWSQYAPDPAEYRARVGRRDVLLWGLRAGDCNGDLHHPRAAHSHLAVGRLGGAVARAGLRDRPNRLLRGRVLLRRADRPAVGRAVPRTHARGSPDATLRDGDESCWFSRG
jgi:hypothetical protein